MGKDLEISLPANALDIYSCDKVDEFISKIEAEARSIVPDTSTEKGRKAIASNAHNVSRSKVALDNLGKDLVSGWKLKSKAVDSERRSVRERLDALRDEVRKPLTDYENDQKARIEAAKLAAELVEAHIEALAENSLIDREREIARKEAEQRRIEQERLDKEAEEKARVERAEYEARVAKEAKERAENEAKEAVERGNREAEESRKAAEENAKQAERDRVAAEEREKINAENAEREKKEASDRARQEEKDRQAEVKRKAAADLKRLEANTRHVGKIRGEAKVGLMKFASEDVAKKIVLAISKGEIENVTISY